MSQEGTFMANYTRRIIMQTFEEMLDEIPFRKITVSSLVNRCEISSNTFYYHFKDIYDLLEVWLDMRGQAYLKLVDQETQWQEAFKTILRGIREHSQRVYHITDSLSRDWLERYIFTYVEQQFHNDLKRRTAEFQIDEKTLEKVSSFFCYAVLGFFIKYLWGNMKADINSSVDELGQIFEGTLSYILQNVEKNTVK